MNDLSDFIDTFLRDIFMVRFYGQADNFHPIDHEIVNRFVNAEELLFILDYIEENLGIGSKLHNEVFDGTNRKIYNKYVCFTNTHCYTFNFNSEIIPLKSSMRDISIDNILN
jgi:hypothetical protein